MAALVESGDFRAIGPVLVTGPHGLLGSWLVKRLVELEVPVVAIQRDRPARSALDAFGISDKISTVRGDVRDVEVIERALVQYEVRTVFHLAAQAIVGNAERSPLDTFDTNVRGTWVMLEAARRAQVEAFVFASSDKAYGAQRELPYRESQQLLASRPYEVSKAAADMIARSYWNSFGLPVAVTRCANLYGGGDFNGSRLIPESVAAALKGRAPILRSDGSPERDFLYVEDAVDAYLMLASCVRQGKGRGDAFNVGNDEPLSIKYVVGKVCELAGSQMQPVIGGETPAEIDRQWVDSSRFRSLTGWRPRHSFDEGLAKTVAWYRNHS